MAVEKPGQILRLDVRVTAAGLVVLASLGLIAAYFWVKPEHREHVKFVSAVIAGGAAIYGAFYAGASLRFTAKRERQKRSFEILDSMGSIDKVGLRHLLEALDRDGLGDAQIFTTVREDKDLWRSAVTTLGELEDMAIAVRHSYADEGILHDSLSHVAPRILEKTGGYIRKLREERNDNKLYCELERLVSSWRDGKSLQSGKRWDD